MSHPSIYVQGTHEALEFVAGLLGFNEDMALEGVSALAGHISSTMNIMVSSMRFSFLPVIFSAFASH
jgi:hypothetical protein